MKKTEMNKVKILIAAMGLWMISCALSEVATAAETPRSYASATPAQVSYKFTDGYGEYSGHGATKIEASSQAREACIMKKVAAYENRFGVTPDADTADLYIDACINR